MEMRKVSKFVVIAGAWLGGAWGLFVTLSDPDVRQNLADTAALLREHWMPVTIGVGIGAALAVAVTWFAMGAVAARRVAAAERSRRISALRITLVTWLQHRPSLDDPWTLHVGISFPGYGALDGAERRLANFNLRVTITPTHPQWSADWDKPDLYISETGDGYTRHEFEIPSAIARRLVREWLSNPFAPPPTIHTHAYARIRSGHDIGPFDSAAPLDLSKIALADARQC